MEVQDLITFVEENERLKDKVEYVEDADGELRCVFFVNNDIAEPDRFYDLNEDVYEFASLRAALVAITKHNLAGVKIILRVLDEPFWKDGYAIDVEYLSWDINLSESCEYIDESYTNEVIDGLKELFFTLKLLGTGVKYQCIDAAVDT